MYFVVQLWSLSQWVWIISLSQIACDGNSPRTDVDWTVDYTDWTVD